MLSIDEAIAYEREVLAKNKYQYECYMECSDNYKQNHKETIAQCKYDFEYHEQIAELLEELRELRIWKNDVMEDFCKVDCGSVDEIYLCGQRIGYNKAINDFVEVLREKRDKRTMKVGCDDLELREIAKQLKEMESD